MGALRDLPLLNLTQLTACEPGVQDPIERFYLNPLNFDQEIAFPLYALEFYAGLNRGELKLKMSQNIVHVRSSIKVLFGEQKLALIPRADVIMKLLEIQKHNRNCKDRFYDRIRYTESLTQQEYDYSLSSIDVKTPLSVILPDDTRQTYQSPHQDMPRFRSSASLLLILSNSARTLDNKFAFPLRNRSEVKVLTLSLKWHVPPRTFSTKPNWQELTHPFERTDDLIKDLFDPKEESVPDLIPDTGSSSSESSLHTELALHPEEWIQNPGTTRWARRIKKIIGRNLPFEQEVMNDKQVVSYAKEKCRSYEEVMRTSRVSVRFGPYIRRKPRKRSRDDISIKFI
ncbi:hypothetical protein VNI00_003618 [Paramarasmius palmivorus]|uniref:Uncharacterized protein n=1 Tax=Paramarasmius palmivorus TaxID=297713 RepID=A0AAW0DTN3_9AGAR